MRAITTEQEAFLATHAIEAGFCGGNDVGKTWSLLFGATKHIEHPRYTAVLLRRHCDEAHASLIERSRAMYAPLGGRYNPARWRWSFPSGATIEFGVSEDLDDAFRYGGANFTYIGIDGIDMFDERQYQFFLSRLRSATSDRLPLRMRLTFHDDPDGDWVSSYFAPWLVPEGMAWECFRAEPGELVYYKRESMHWRRVQSDERGALSRTLIKARCKKSGEKAHEFVNR